MENGTKARHVPFKACCTAGGKGAQDFLCFCLTFVWRSQTKQLWWQEESALWVTNTHANTFSRTHATLCDCGLDGLSVIGRSEAIYQGERDRGKCKACWLCRPSGRGSKWKFPVTKTPWSLSGKRSFSLDRTDEKSSPCRCGLSAAHTGNDPWHFCMHFEWVNEQVNEWKPPLNLLEDDI